MKARLQRWKWPALALAAACAVAAFLFLLYLRSPKHGLPYHDSFAQGGADEWEAFGGTWAVYDGGMRNDSDERGAKLMTGSPYWKNYLVEADVMLLGEDGDAGLIIRASDEEQGVDSYSGYYAGLRTRDNMLTLGRASHGWLEYRNVSMPESVRAFQWYHLKLLAYGCDIVASATFPLNSGHTTTASMTDKNCLVSGRIGLRSYSAGGFWRNIQARVATENDLRAMLGNTRTQTGSSEQVAGNGITIFGSGSLPSHLNAQVRPAANVEPVSSLRLVSSSQPITATIRGVVSLTAPLYVQDSTGGISVHTSTSPPLKVGDEIQATGTVSPGAFHSTLEDAKVQLLWARTPVQPVAVTASQAATGAFAAMFIEVEGHLRSKEREAENNLALGLEDGQQSFRAVVNAGRGDLLFNKLKPGSLLRLRGVCVVDSEYTHNLTPFVLLLRSTDDIEVVAGPPWWNARHVIAAGFVLLLLLLIGHFIYSRIEQWRLRAILEEREMLAHEMHDTLAQSFAGLGFQLQAIRNRMPEDMPALHKQIELACDLVRHSHEEARRDIMMLRTESFEQMELTRMLEQCAKKMLDGGNVEIAVSQTGDLRPLPLRINDTLFRIGQEALANAVRHATPKRISIMTAYTKDSVQMVIEDDGSGYDAGSEKKGFGVRGMKRRAAAISAAIEIATSPNLGTRVQVTAPLPAGMHLKYWAGKKRKSDS
jgi:signal transduction histidine kinase